MKERPILFNAPMVRALLDGSKTQTRRVCKQQPYSNGYKWDGNDILCHNDYLPPSAMLMDAGGKALYTTSNLEGWESECPYGQPGDRLWVREAFGEVYDWCDHPEMPGAPTERWHIEYKYRADGEVDRSDLDGAFTGWKPSIHMPRAASRILLEIVSVRVEQLQDISDEDCLAEGVRAIRHEGDGTYYHYEHTYADPGNWCNADVAYQHLWESIKGAGSWDANPWVWVVEFKRMPA